MTVAELIIKLQAMPQDAEVRLTDEEVDYEATSVNHWYTGVVHIL